VSSTARGSEAGRVLIVDDDLSAGMLLERRLTRDGFAVETARDSATVLELLQSGVGDWDAAVLDISIPGMPGTELLRIIQERSPMTSVIMLTGDDRAATATTCLRAGAFHYLTKSFDLGEISSAVQAAARHSTVRRRLREQPAKPGTMALVGTSLALKELRTAIDQISRQDAPVLLRGESGTGKEVAARTIHERSPRAGKPFIAVNCSAIPEGLIDSELFGHERGAFTGALADRNGVFAEAEGGTLFLDEIGDMPLAVQGRLLRALQEREIRPVGSNAVRKVDVRVIAATHVNLAEAIERGTFRQDLFYRLNVLALHLPPLRERRDDIALLAAHFLRKHGGIAPPQLSPAALEALVAAPWPGNVRELENALLHAIAYAPEGEIGLDALPPEIKAKGSSPIKKLTADDVLRPLAEAKREMNDRFEREYLIKVMKAGNGSVSEAARIAGIDRTNLRRLLKRHGITADLFRGR
jgi:DNA-binding NtrC family response regulator